MDWVEPCLKRWGSWRLVDWVFSDSWASRRFVREKGNRGWGLDVLAIASDGWFESSSIEWWGKGRMGTWGLEGIGVMEASTEVDSIRWQLRDIYINQTPNRYSPESRNRYTWSCSHILWILSMKEDLFIHQLIQSHFAMSMCSWSWRVKC